MKSFWVLQIVVLLAALRYSKSQPCSEVVSLDPPRDRPSFEHMATVEATSFQDTTAGTKVAEVYAFGYAHCQFMVRYQAVAVNPPDALTYFSLSANDGSNTDGIIRRVGGDLSAASNRGRVFEIRIDAFYSNRMDTNDFVSVNVKVAILQSNRAPVFSPTTQQLSFTEYDDLEQGDVLYRYTFTDSEDGPEGEFEFFVFQTQPNEDEEGGQHFSIDPKTGDFYVNREWSFSVGETFTLQLYARDFGSPRLKSAEQTITISIILRPITPIFLQDKYYVETPEKTSYDVPTSIPCAGNADYFTGDERFLIGVKAVDGNTQSEADITYSIMSVVPAGLTFHIVDVVLGNTTDRGDIYMCGSPNREVDQEYTLVVRATDRDVDGGNPALFAEAHVYVNITDRNEPPHFLRSHYYGTIAEWAHSGAVVVDDLEAVDDDIGINAELTYSIVPGSVVTVDVFNNLQNLSDNSFTIDSATGVLRDNIESISETYRYFRMNVRAIDSGIPPFTATTQVYLTIVDINDNEPVFGQTSYTLYRCENRAANDDPLFMFTVSDYDLVTTHSTLTFSTEGHYSDQFYIPPGSVHTEYPQPDSQDAAVTTGELRVTGSFDYETTKKIDIVVLARDNSERPLTGTANVDLVICDDNDNPPYFEEDNYHITMSEDTTVGTVLTTIRVLDDDGPLHSISTLASGDGRFATNNSHNAMGVFAFSLAMTIDIETLPEADDCIDLTVTATNAPGMVPTACIGSPSCAGGPLTATTAIRVCITDVNEHCPLLDSNTYSETIDENTPHGTLVLTVAATDADKHAPNNVINFFIVAASNDHVLSVDKESGEVTVDNPPDYEDFPAGTATADRCHSLTVGVFDRGAKDTIIDGPCDSQAVVTVCLNNLNDETPTCDECPYEGSVQENAATGTPIVTVAASDPDGDALTYTITTDDSGGAFALGGSSGEITVLNSTLLDYEMQTSHNLVVTASDGVHSITIHVTIVVLDDNDHCPMFETASIPHGTTVRECPNDNRGGYVTTVSAVDVDTDPNVNTQYTIASTTPASGPFVIGQLSGEIHISQAGLNVDAPGGVTQWTLTVQASDTQLASCAEMITFTVDVTDCNDITPVITPGTQPDVCEHDPVGTVAVNFMVSDGDLNSPNNVFTAEIVNGTNGPLQDGVAPFQLVDAGAGAYEIQFNTANIDWERPSSVRDGDEKVLFYPTIRVTDGGTPPLVIEHEFIIRVCDINDNCPNFVPAPPTGGYTRTISERTPMGTTVIQLAAFDPDSSTNSVLTWSTSGCADFDIDSSTGRFFTNVASLTQGSTHTCQICVTSAGTTSTDCPRCVSLEVSVTDVNNNCPVIAVTGMVTSFPEQEDGTSTVFPAEVATITVTDADLSANTELTLRIENPSGITTDAFPFQLTQVGPVTGTLTSTLQLRGPTDHEDISRYNILVVANDRVVGDGDGTGGHTCESSMLLDPITITDVVDEPPVLSAHDIQGYIDENAAAGSTVFITPGLHVTDLDALHTPDDPPDSVSVSLQAVARRKRAVSDFAVSTLAGTQDIYPVTITTTAVLDHEATPSIQFEVVAMDTGGLADTATVTVTVRDLNDNIPTCNQAYLTQQNHMWSLVDGLCSISTTVCENATVDHRVLDIAFFDAFDDADSGSNGDFFLDVQHYNLGGDAAPDPGNPGLNFQDDFGIRQNDLLVITQPLNYEELIAAGTGFEIYRLRVLARDQGSPQQTGTILVNVEVCDSNDNPPVFTEPEVLVRIDEEMETLIHTFTVNDLDFGTNSMQEFNIIDVQPLVFRDQFSLRGIMSHSRPDDDDHESTAQLWTLPLDRETQETYTIYVEAKDLGNPRLSATATVTLVLNDVNDNTPVWPLDYPFPCVPFSIDEELPLYYVISSFSAMDADAGENAQLSYTIAVDPADQASRFTIGSNDGALRQNGESLDYENAAIAGQTYTITVTVTDGGVTARTNTATICFTVNNINDNPPMCPDNSYQCIDEYPFDSSMMTPMIYNMNVFGQFPCADADGNAGENFRYMIGNDIDSGLFQIDAMDRLVIAPGSETMFDRETDEERHLTLVVEDNGFPDSTGPVMNHSIFVTVCLQDVNDNAPVFDDVPVGCVLFAEGISDQTVAELVVRDNDAGANGQLTVTHTEDQGSSDFNVAIVEQPGSAVRHVRVTPTRALDREDRDMYILTITVTDGGIDCLAAGKMMAGSPCSTTISLCVRITDINDNSNNLTDVFFCISEDPAKTQIGSTIFRMNVVDADLGANAAIEYDLVNGTIDLPFSITRTTGEILLAAPVDFETRTAYHLVVSAKDSGNYSQTEYANVTICIMNEPDTPPQFTMNPTLTAVEERDNQYIGTLSDFVFDPDMLGEDIHYVLPDQTEFNDIIEIDRLSGNITVAKKLNREARDSYTLTVGATNDHDAYERLFLNTRTAYAQLTINVLDINDNTPMFENAFYLIAIDHELEYGEEVDSVFASDIDLGDNATVNYEFVHGLNHEPYFTINRTTGVISSAGAFVWRIGDRFEFMVRAYDHFKMPLELPQNDDGWRYQDVPITFYAAEEQTRVLVRINIAFNDVQMQDRTCVRNVLETVSHFMIYIDRIRHAASDSYYQVSPAITEFVIHAVHPNTQEVPHADELLRLIDTDQLSDLLRVDCGLTLLDAGLVDPVRSIPIQYDRTEIYIGLIVGVVLGGFLILCCCLLCGCFCCWERRRRRTYQKKITSVSNLDQFSHSFFATKNPLFVPALGDATSESVESGSMADRDNILYASQELEVTLEDELGEDEEWLKMDQPPEWLLPPEKEEYDDWTPPERKPLIPPPPKPVIAEPQKVVTVETHEVVKEQVETVEEKTEQVKGKETKEVVPVGFKRAKKKDKKKEYDEQETFLEVFADVDSEGLESDGELRLSNLPSEVASDDDEVQVDADTFGVEAFQSTITSGDFPDDDETPLIQ